MDIARRFFEAMSLDFERAGIVAPEPSADFFRFKSRMHELAISHELFFVLESFPVSKKLRELNIGLFRIEPSSETPDLLGRFDFRHLNHKYTGREQFDIYRVREVLHPTRSYYLGYTERMPGRGMSILLFPDEIRSMSKELNVTEYAMRRYVIANEFGHVYLNDYLLTRGFPDLLLGGHTGSVPAFSFPFSRRSLSFLEFHEAFSDVASAKYGGLDMHSLFDLYAHLRSGDVPPVYRFSIAMQNFAFHPAVKRHLNHMPKQFDTNTDESFAFRQASAELRASPELGPIVYREYVERLEGRLAPLALSIARIGNATVEHIDPVEEQM